MIPIDKGEDAKGIYRSIYVSLWEDRDFQTLDPTVKLVLINLRTSPLSNMPCIYPIYYEAIQKQTGLSEGTIRDAIDILRKANWIDYEDGIVWVKKGLKFDPVISMRNDHHIRAIRKAIRALPKLAIVDSFLEFYKLSIEDPGKSNTEKTISVETLGRLVNLWNIVCGRVLPKIISTPDTRIRHMEARLAERPDFEFWKEYFQKIVNTPFLTGENPRGWKANFDWIINITNMTKVLEGNWPTIQDRKPPQKQPSPSTKSLWGNCEKCKKETLKTNMNQAGLCFNCNPESEQQTKRLQALMQNIVKKIPSELPSTLSKSEEME